LKICLKSWTKKIYLPTVMGPLFQQNAMAVFVVADGQDDVRSS
jgi:hypothetical protein